MKTNSKSVSTKYTPECINSLRKHEIFVFGSNRLGKHIGGAARIAKDKFGAQEGISQGLTGQTYAIPTLDENFQKVRETELLFSFVRFLKFVKDDPTHEYLLTKVGCGIAGWDLKRVVYIFRMALKRSLGNELPENLSIPREFELKEE